MLTDHLQLEQRKGEQLGLPSLGSALGNGRWPCQNEQHCDEEDGWDGWETPNSGCAPKNSSMDGSGVKKGLALI